MPKKKDKEPELLAPKRINRELMELMETQTLPGIFDLKAEDEKLLKWRALVLPEKPPYNTGAWFIEINFPETYPFKPPKIQFLTKIYHPNIDEKGMVCLAILAPENWKPTIRIELVLHALVALVSDPDTENPLRNDINEDFLKDKKKFMRMAEDYTKRFSERRPDEEEIRIFIKKRLKALKEAKMK